MSISITCACGKTLRVRDEAAGKNAKCPACQALLTVPKPEADIDLLPEEPPNPPPGRICPQCQASSQPGPPVCAACGHVFEGAPPPSARHGRVYSSEKDFDKPPIFPLMVLGMVYRPAYILEYFRGWASRPVVFFQIILLYVGSLAALSGVAVAGYAGPRERSAPAPEENPAGARRAEEREEILVWKPLPDRMGIEAHLAPEHPEAGKPTRLWLAVNKEGKRIPVSVIATVEQSPTQDWSGFGGEEDWKPRTVGRSVPARPLVFERDAASGCEVCRFTPPDPGVYRFVFRTDPAFEGEPYEAEVHVRPARPAPEAEAAPVPKAITAATRILFTLLVSLISIAINALAINLASRVFGEAGDFFFLMVVLAFVQSIVNLGQLALLAVGPAVGPDWAFFSVYAFGLWEFVLVLIAIMKVYEFDLGGALLTSAIAAVIKMWGVMLLVGKVMGL